MPRCGKRRGGAASSASLAGSTSKSSGLFSRIKEFLKKHKVISRGARAISGIVPAHYTPYLNFGANYAESKGYGRKRKRTVRKRRTRRGRGLGEILKSGISAARSAYSTASPVVKAGIARLRSKLGLGRRRKRVIRRRRRRGSAFTDFFTKTIPRGARAFGGISDKIRKPSTWLGAASLLPTPFATPLKAAAAITGATGNGRRRRRRGGMKMMPAVMRMRGMGTMSTQPMF